MLRHAGDGPQPLNSLKTASTVGLWCVEDVIICGEDGIVCGMLMEWRQHCLWDSDVLKMAASVGKTASAVGFWCAENSIDCGTLMCWRHITCGTDVLKTHTLWDSDVLKTHNLWEDDIIFLDTTKHAEQCLSSGATSSLLLRNIGVKRDQTQWRSQVVQLHQPYWETLEWKETRHSGDPRWSNFISLTEKHWSEKRPDTVEIRGGPTSSALLRNIGVIRDQIQWRSEVVQLHQPYWETLEWKETRHSGDLRWSNFISLTEKHWSENRPDTVTVKIPVDRLHQSTVSYMAFINTVNISNDYAASLDAGCLLLTWSCDGGQCCQWKCAAVLSPLCSTPVGRTMQFPGHCSCASTISTQYFKAGIYADKCRLEHAESICPVGRMEAKGKVSVDVWSSRRLTFFWRLTLDVFLLSLCIVPKEWLVFYS